MQAKKDISEELKLLSAVVDSISRETPYRVPAGYFEEFPAKVLRLTNPDEPQFSLGKDKPLAFSVPEGYFDSFAQNLLSRIKMEAAAIPEKNRTETAVPAQGRTESAAEELADLSPILAGISREMPFRVPADYFETMSPVEAMLTGVKEKITYTVPQGYFDNLAENILIQVARTGAKKTTEVKEPARIVTMRTWMRYATAAVVAGLIFTFGWLRFNHHTGNHPATAVDIAGNLVKVSDQELQSYLDNHNDQTNTMAEPTNNTATLDINDSDVKSLLGDVPDGDLKQYMEEHGGADDIATN